MFFNCNRFLNTVFFHHIFYMNYDVFLWLLLRVMVSDFIHFIACVPSFCFNWLLPGICQLRAWWRWRWEEERGERSWDSSFTSLCLSFVWQVISLFLPPMSVLKGSVPSFHLGIISLQIREKRGFRIVFMRGFQHLYHLDNQFLTLVRFDWCLYVISLFLCLYIGTKYVYIIL